MMDQTVIKLISKFFLVIFVLSQILLISSYILIPKPAEALFPVIKLADVYQVIKDFALGALRQVAIDFANKYLTKLVSKIQEKYKIQNYLYYDQVLSNYYLSNYISDKIQDPDLRQIYGLLNAGFVTGQPTGTTGGPNPSNALIPKLKTAINNYYQNNFGVPENVVASNPGNLSGFDYYSASFNYYLNPPSYVAQNLRGQFGAFQTEATTAAQLEVIVGNGLKAGRIVGGVCSLGYTNNAGPMGFLPSLMEKIGIVQVAHAQTLPSTPTIESGGDPPGLPPGQTPQTYIEHQTDSPASCQAQGGSWQPSALDNVRSFIQNPTTFTAGWMDSAIKQITGNKFDPNNYAAVIGSFVGNFIFNQLTITKNDGTLNETPIPYKTDSGNGVGSKGIDIDADGIIDGYDTNNDGQPEICVYGGVPDPITGSGTVGPPCQGSNAALTNPTPAPTSECSPVPTAAQTQESQDAIDFITPLLEAIPKMNPVVSPPPQDYQNAVQDAVDRTNANFPGVKASYAPYASDNVIAMVFNYLVGPADHVVSGQVGIGDTWRNAWRVTCTTTPPGGGGLTCANVPNAQACTAPNRTDLVQNVKNYVVAHGINISGNCGAFEIVKRVAWALRGTGGGYIATFHSSRCDTNGYSADLLGYPDGSMVDILGSSGTANNPQWLPGPASTESGVYYVASTDPGDPPGSY